MTHKAVKVHSATNDVIAVDPYAAEVERMRVMVSLRVGNGREALPELEKRTRCSHG